MNLIKSLIKEPTTWAGLAMLMTAGGRFFAEGDPTGAWEMVTAGVLLILLRGRKIPGLGGKSGLVK